MATFNDFTGLLGTKGSTSTSSKTNSLLGFLDEEQKWLPKKEQQEQMNLLQQGTAGNTAPGAGTAGMGGDKGGAQYPVPRGAMGLPYAHTGTKEMEPFPTEGQRTLTAATPDNPNAPGGGEFSNMPPLDNNITEGVEKFVDATQEIPKEVPGETVAEMEYREQDLKRLADATNTDVDKAKKEVAKNTETGADASKAAIAMNEEVGKTLQNSGDDSEHVQEYKALMESGVGEQVTQESFWDNLPGVDRIDWMTALLTAGTSIAMGNELGLAAANGMLNGLISGDKSAAREKTQASDAAIAQSKQNAIDMRAQRTADATQGRHEDNLAQKNASATYSSMKLPEVNQWGESLKSSGMGFFGGPLNGDKVDAAAPKVIQLQGSVQGFASLPKETQFRAAMAFDEGNASKANNIIKQALTKSAAGA
jgi:hypothetical protein